MTTATKQRRHIFEFQKNLDGLRAMYPVVDIEGLQRLMAKVISDHKRQQSSGADVAASCAVAAVLHVGESIDKRLRALERSIADRTGQLDAQMNTLLRQAYVGFNDDTPDDPS